MATEEPVYKKTLAESFRGRADRPVARFGGMADGREMRPTLHTREPVLVGRFRFSHVLRVLGDLLENAIENAPADAPIDFTLRLPAADLSAVAATIPDLMLAS